jgi:hypothetical protein
LWLSIYILAVNFSGIFWKIRKIETVEKLRTYEDLYKAAKKPSDRRRSSATKRYSLLGQDLIREVVQLYEYRVYDKCRTINLALKLVVMVVYFVLSLLTWLDLLHAEAFYELPALVFLELGVYVFYLDYLPTSVD